MSIAFLSLLSGRAPIEYEDGRYSRYVDSR